MSLSAESQPETELSDERFFAAVAAHDFFTTQKAISVARAPGRLDFMGGNVDYTGGMVLQSLLREAIWVAAQPRDDNVICILNPGAAQFGWQSYVEFRSGDVDDPQQLNALIRENEDSRWTGYVLGALCFLRTRYADADVQGMNLLIASDLPPNKGVSSSAALEIATLKAAAAACGRTLDGIALATAGQWVENVVVGAACGIMDQAAIVLGKKDQLLPLLCQPCQPFPPVTLPAGIRIWGIDSLAPRSTSGAAYETARAAAFIGYKLICQREGIDVHPDGGAEIPRWNDSRWKGYLSNLSPSEFRAKYERCLPESLSGREFLARGGEHVDPFTRIEPDSEYPVRAAVRYAAEESFRVRMMSALLASELRSGADSTMELIGEILCQSHSAYRECGLGSEACDDLVARAREAGSLGAKMTGGGGGGVVAVVGRAEDRSIIQRIAQEYGAERGATPHIFEGSSEGADTFDVRRMYPRY
jgi:galactokinase